jgi:hypothetical protein
LNATVCKNENRASATRGSTSGQASPNSRLLRWLSITQRIARTKIAQIKKAFHHGSAVPYGMAVITINPNAEKKIVALRTRATRAFAEDVCT